MGEAPGDAADPAVAGAAGGARRDFDPARLGPSVYPLLNSLVVPRPIAWVSTRSAQGVDNLAPHSYFTVSSVLPPVVQFTSIGHKDSLRNAEATGEFVVCVCTEPLLEVVNRTATDFPAEVSEFDEVGLTREPSVAVAPPRVAQSPVALECRLAGTRSFGDSTVVFGEVVHIAVREDVLREGTRGWLAGVDLLRPVSRLGADDWATVGTVTAHRRIRFAEWQEGHR